MNIGCEGVNGGGGRKAGRGGKKEYDDGIESLADVGAQCEFVSPCGALARSTEKYWENDGEDVIRSISFASYREYRELVSLPVHSCT